MPKQPSPSKAVKRKAAPKSKGKEITVKARLAQLSDLVPDDHNARKHTDNSMLRQSVKEFGPARGVLLGKSDKIRGGNATVESLMAEGYKDVIIVKGDRHTLIAVQRDDLDEDGERRLALFDNRTGEMSSWSGSIIAEFAQQNAAVLDGIFGPADLSRLFAEAAAEFRAQGIPGDGPDGVAAPEVPESHVRMQQLFLDMNTFPEFHEICERLMKAWATTTPTDTVMEALRRCDAHPKKR